MLLGPYRTFRDPVHGDIQLPEGVLTDLIDHPDFQRLRRIRQLGMCYCTFHGAEHTRFQHALGACWLAFQVLRRWVFEQQVEVEPEDVQATLCAILLHDVGHGPFSHALEHVFHGVDHEAISCHLIRTRFRRVLDSHGVDPERVLSLLKGEHPQVFLGELISGQLDVDRMDYLVRDTLFTGVGYGQLDLQRLLGSLGAVFDLERGSRVLVVDAKAAQAAEAFLFARYFMHWQVYFHRTVRASEFLLRSILARARVAATAHEIPPRLRFLFESGEDFTADFVACDDGDVISAIKDWSHAQDPLLRDLCRRLLSRRLPKVVEGPPEHLTAVRELVASRFEEVDYYFGVDRPSDLALGSKPIRVLTGPGRRWTELSQVSGTAALRALSERVSREYWMVPEECREQAERLVFAR
jgi:HD superfamily phosphohydrolase